MSDVEIKKALEVCSTGFCISGECPFYDDNDGNDICACTGRLSKAALSLIEKQQEQIEFEKGMRTLAEQDCADRDEMLKQKVEVVYEDFMRDYKLLQEENDGLCKEIAEYRAEIERERHLNDKRRMDYENIVNYVAETFKKRAEKAICDNTYPDFNKNGKPVNVWKAWEGFNALEEIKNQLLEET